MSKTFKALQRAAKERASRKPGKPDAPPREEKSSPPPSVAAARVKAIASTKPEPPEVESPPIESKSTSAPADLTGEMDPSLRVILEKAFAAAEQGIEIGEDGWVRGSLDQPSRDALLARYGLLHCLTLDEQNSFWFWASLREAKELAERSGCPLDDEA